MGGQPAPVGSSGSGGRSGDRVQQVLQEALWIGDFCEQTCSGDRQAGREQERAAPPSQGCRVPGEHTAAPTSPTAAAAGRAVVTAQTVEERTLPLCGRRPARGVPVAGPTSRPPLNPGAWTTAGPAGPVQGSVHGAGRGGASGKESVHSLQHVPEGPGGWRSREGEWDPGLL